MRVGEKRKEEALRRGPSFAGRSATKALECGDGAKSRIEDQNGRCDTRLDGEYQKGETRSVVWMHWR